LRPNQFSRGTLQTARPFDLSNFEVQIPVIET
jgi:hypothetical protein